MRKYIKNIISKVIPPVNSILKRVGYEIIKKEEIKESTEK